MIVMDIIDLIDQAITPTCGQCGAEITDGLSDDFCGPDCQRAWHEARSEPLVGYREPSDVPEHVHNLIELGSPETTPSCPRDSDTLMPGWFADRMHAYWAELNTHTNVPPALRRPQIEAEPDRVTVHFNNQNDRWLPRDLTDDRRHLWIGPHPGDGLDHIRHAVNALANPAPATSSGAAPPRQPYPLDPGAPWIRSPITPASMPPTGVLIGGRRHGETIGTANPPHRTVDTIEPVDPDQTLFNSDTIRFKRVTYRLVGHNGVHWCYVAPGTTRTLDGDEPLTVEYHHNDFPRDMWWVTITGRTCGVLCELTNELLASDAAVRAWFTDRAPHGGWPITDGSWEITETCPPFRREQT